MKNSTMPNAHLHGLLLDGMRDMLGAERQLLKGLKKLSKATKSANLRAAFETHYEQTGEHIERLRLAFSSLDLHVRAKKCKAMEGLLKEAEELIEEFESQSDVLDAALIAAAQKVEHYEIASYGCIATYADLMGHQEISDLMGQTLKEEKETDEHLTKLAMEQVHVEA